MIYKTVKVPETSEGEIMDRMLASHIKGAVYDEKTKKVHIPKEVENSIKRKENTYII